MAHRILPADDLYLAGQFHQVRVPAPEGWRSAVQPLKRRLCQLIRDTEHNLHVLLITTFWPHATACLTATMFHMSCKVQLTLQGAARSAQRGSHEPVHLTERTCSRAIDNVDDTLHPQRMTRVQLALRERGRDTSPI